MGGKHKQQAHRIKNNARPSSSGRSAELLAANAGFSPFSVPFKSGAAFSLVPFGESLDIDMPVDSSFQLALKKMGKKDATTRLKGLQEFSEAVKSIEGDATEVRAVLASWLRQYETLVTDSEHRVREAANLAHREVVKKVGKGIAPFLKQIAGAWFTSQYDTYAPAASAALLSFEDAFPPAKQRDAIVYCQDEILAYVRSNITVQTAQTQTSTKANLSAEDAAAKYERIIVSSLLGYRLYLERVTSSSSILPSPSTIPHHTALLTHTRFWQLAKHKSPLVRRAWFGLMGAMCQRAPTLLNLGSDGTVAAESVVMEDKVLEDGGGGVVEVGVMAKKQQQKSVGGRLVQAVIGQLDDGEPTVMMAVWETMLLSITSIDNWWKYISIEKLMLPKLFKVLREGGMGNASTVYPSLLPLILHLPSTLNAETFYPPLFDSIRQGLRHRTVLSSRSESTSTSMAFVECLRYTIKCQHENKALCHKLFVSYLFPTMEWCLRDHSQSIYKTFFNQVSTFIQHLHQNKSDFPNFSLYLETFWSNSTSMFEGLLMDSDPETAILYVAKQSELLQSLKSVNNKAKKQLKVKFDTTTSQSHLNSSTSSDSDSQITVVDRDYMGRLDALVYSNCECIVKYIKGKHCKGLLEHLQALLQDFASDTFMRNLGDGSLMGLYTGLFGKWLKSSYLCSKPVVSMIFLLFKYLTDEEKLVILEDFMNVETEDCIGWCICRAMSHPYHNDDQIKVWLKNERVGNFLLHIVELEMEDTCTPDLSLLLKKAFQENSENNLLLSSSTVEQIMTKLSECLTTPVRFTITIDTCASLAAHITSIVYTETALLSHGDQLLLALFALSCNTEVDEEYLSDDTRWEIATAWQDAVALLAVSLSKEDILKLTGKFATILYESSEAKSSDIAEKVVSFAKAVRKGRNNLVGDVLEMILHQNTAVLDSMADFNQVCLISAYISGHLVCPKTNLSPVNISELNVVNLFRWWEVISTVLASIEDDDQYEELLDDDGNTVNKDMLVIELTNECAKEFVHIVYSAKLGEAYLREFKSLQYSNKISESCDILKSQIKKIYDKLQLTHFEQIRSILLTKVQNEGFFWTHALRQLNLEMMPKIFNLYIDATSLDTFNLGQLHLVQTFAKDLVYHDVCDIKTTEFGRIVTLRSLINCDDLDIQVAEVYTAIARLKNSEKSKQVFYNIDFSNWEQAEMSIEIMRMCAAFISSDKTKTMSKNHWDFILISLAAWASRLDDVKANYQNIQVVAFAVSVAKLFVAVSSFIKRLEDEDVQSNYIDEWNDLFAENAQLEIVKAWLFFGDELQSTSTNQHHHLLLLTHFLPTCSHLVDTYLFRPSDLANINMWTQVVKRACSLLLYRHQPALQLAGHRMLAQIAGGIAAVDGAAVLDMKDVREGGLVMEQLGSLLAETGEVVRVMLLEFRLGEDSCRVEPYTDSYTFTLAYLLIWDILLMLCDKSSTELRYQYAQWMKEKDYLTILLNNSFKLMPSEVLHTVDGKSKPLKHYFVEKFDFPFKGGVTSERLERLVCWVFNGAVHQLSALVRQWWADADTRTAQIVERVTRAYVSPSLCHKELTDVTSSEKTFKNMVIKVHPTVRELIAVYTIDDAQMELVITLPPNYPLAGAEVDCQKQIGGTAHKLLMQLRMCIQHQNGRIWDGLMLWNNNLDKRFDGVEECYICFALIHQGTYQIPKLSCSTCKKKFHSACLYKWFSTSNKSTCPICRNLF